MERAIQAASTRSGWYEEASGGRRWWRPETGWTQDVLTRAGTPSVDPGPSPLTALPSGTPLTEPDPVLGGLVPVVFLPCASPVGPEDSDVELESYETEDGTALLVFSSLDALVEGCGEEQPWITVPLTSLGDVHRLCAGAAGESELLWDAVLPTSLRHPRQPLDQPLRRRPETF